MLRYNRAHTSGGGLQKSSGLSCVGMSNVSFDGNYARTQGGGAYIQGGCHDVHPRVPCRVEDCTFKGNTASLGGALFIDAVIPISTDGGVVSAATVNYQKWAPPEPAPVWVNGTSFMNNVAKDTDEYGGGGGGTCNTMAGCGGAIFVKMIQSSIAWASLNASTHIPATAPVATQPGGGGGGGAGIDDCRSRATVHRMRLSMSLGTVDITNNNALTGGGGMFWEASKHGDESGFNTPQWCQQERLSQLGGSGSARSSTITADALTHPPVHVPWTASFATFQGNQADGWGGDTASSTYYVELITADNKLTPSSSSSSSSTTSPLCDIDTVGGTCTDSTSPSIIPTALASATTPLSSTSGLLRGQSIDGDDAAGGGGNTGLNTGNTGMVYTTKPFNVAVVALDAFRQQLQGVHAEVLVNFDITGSGDVSECKSQSSTTSSSTSASAPTSPMSSSTSAVTTHTIRKRRIVVEGAAVFKQVCITAPPKTNASFLVTARPAPISPIPRWTVIIEVMCDQLLKCCSTGMAHCRIVPDPNAPYTAQHRVPNHPTHLSNLLPPSPFLPPLIAPVYPSRLPLPPLCAHLRPRASAPPHAHPAPHQENQLQVRWEVQLAIVGGSLLAILIILYILKRFCSATIQPSMWLVFEMGSAAFLIIMNLVDVATDVVVTAVVLGSPLDALIPFRNYSIAATCVASVACVVDIYTHVKHICVIKKEMQKRWADKEVLNQAKKFVGEDD